jgi:hypothetical protein
MRDLAPEADLRGQVVVAARALDQHAEAGIGKTRAAVLDH